MREGDEGGQPGQAPEGGVMSVGPGRGGGKPLTGVDGPMDGWKSGEAGHEVPSVITVLYKVSLLRPYYTAQLIALTTATELQQLLSALLHTGNQYSVGCCKGRVL